MLGNQWVLAMPDTVAVPLVVVADPINSVGLCISSLRTFGPISRTSGKQTLKRFLIKNAPQIVAMEPDPRFEPRDTPVYRCSSWRHDEAVAYTHDHA